MFVQDVFLYLMVTRHKLTVHYKKVYVSLESSASLVAGRNLY
jgi:hypothetical protein